MKIMDEEGEPKGGEGDIAKKDCSLSCDGWIMLLSHEIYRQERFAIGGGFTQNLALLLMILFALMGWMFSVGNTNLSVPDVNRVLFVLRYLYVGTALLAVYILYGIYVLMIYHLKDKKRVKALENLREKIIFGDLTDSIKMQWEKINEIYSVSLWKLCLPETIRRSQKIVKSL